MTIKASSMRSWVAASTAVMVLALGGAGVAGAATSGSSTSTAAKATAATAKAKAARAKAAVTAIDPSTLTHGPGESLVTGADLAKATAAATAAVPGATIIRVETDSGGATYEAHLTKADGTNVTVKFDASFNVTATQDGFGSGGPRP